MAKKHGSRMWGIYNAGRFFLGVGRSHNQKRMTKSGVGFGATNKESGHETTVGYAERNICNKAKTPRKTAFSNG